MQIVTIIGCGFSGIALALNLLRGDSKLKINLVDKRGHQGFGQIFSGEEKCFLLNEPAINMGAYADEPDHFYKWVLNQGIEAGPYDFLPRRLYRNYLHDLLEKAIQGNLGNVLVQKHFDEAVDITEVENGALVTLKQGETFFTDKVILAFGNLSNKVPQVIEKEFLNSTNYFHNPYHFNNYEEYNRIAILGTGTMMADVVSKMYCSNFKGKILAISTSGKTPVVKEHHITAPAHFDETEKIRGFDALFKTIKILFKNQMSWQYTFDSLRPHFNTIWKHLNLSDKKKFLKYFQSLYKKCRFRIPPAYTIALNKLKANNQLELIAGTVGGITEYSSGFKLKIVKGESEKFIKADAIINCSGPETNFKKIPNVLVQNLLAQGIIRCDSLKLGLDARDNGALIRANGKPSSTFFTIGAALKGILGDCSDVPEIRQQAHKLAVALSTPQKQTVQIL